MKISPLACVDSRAQLASDVEVGPFCVIGPDVVLGAGCRLYNNVTIIGHTTLGRGNVIFPNAVIGAPPQDKKYHGEVTFLEIGDNNLIREMVTINCGTAKGGGVTRIGSNNMLMVGVHVAHDVQMGSNCILANNVQMAGHVVIGDYVNMAGNVGIHHFVTVGEYAFLCGASRIHHDVPPYMKVDGADEVRGVNKVGLSRAGFSQEDIAALDEACRRLFYREKPFSVALDELDGNNGLNRHVKRLVQFLRQRDMGCKGRFLESKRAR